MWKDIARRTGIAADNHSMTLADRAGDLGAAHALFALGLALDAANPGDHVLAAGFGSGCDALVFRVESPIPGAGAMRAALATGDITSDYVRFLPLRGAIDLDFGVRSEFEPQAPAKIGRAAGREGVRRDVEISGVVGRGK